MKQISEKCMMILVCLMLAGCGSKAEMYLEQSGTELAGGQTEPGTGLAGGKTKSDTELAGGQTESGTGLTAGQSDSSKAGETKNNSGTTAAGADTDSGQNAPVGGKIAVYVCGEVKNPGVYELTAGMRICDAIEAAGGFTKNAGREYWNLAAPLTDGQMLSVPTREEAQKRAAAAEQTGAAPQEQQSSGSTAGESDVLVNINTADAALLTSVPGIGRVRAEAVIAYRREHGSFLRTEDIKKVSGIGDALFAKMKDHITVS
ncbi:MAG: helix-hairpin-helix domain-containing protein [Lachnospiraceae bacterium]|nr:helix-hairpin-helix domain-containing protein [Lachnospiraceae bacterium]